MNQLQNLTVSSHQPNTDHLKIDWLSGKNIQSYINELKQKLGGAGTNPKGNAFRSKSQEKTHHQN
jgi:hypothetical protein